jgi:VWFA-related protein
MRSPRFAAWAAAGTLAIAVAAGHAPVRAQQPAQGEGQAFRFRSAVELINVNATVTDASGRFVSGLRKDDFRVYEDERLQTITHFSSERVPVSLGIVLDTSGSMAGEKMAAARRALNRFLFDLLGPDDEIFLYRFDSDPELVHGWTSDRRALSAALDRLKPDGGTALYDAVAAAVPLMRTGRHRKKALLVISDGNDTSSTIDAAALKSMIRESEVLVYAVGIDARAGTDAPWTIRQEPLVQLARFQQRPIPLPFPIPGTRRPRPGSPLPPSPLPPRGPTLPPRRYPTPPVNPRSAPSRSLPRDGVNIAALRDITDDSGGRTEIIRSAFDLDPATAGIADELSKQYYLGYPASGVRDGRWHAIRVEVRPGQYRVRARRGFMAGQ